MDLAIDFHGRFSPAMSKRMIRALEPYYPFFIEEPCLPGNIDALIELKIQQLFHWQQVSGYLLNGVFENLLNVKQLQFFNLTFVMQEVSEK